MFWSFLISALLPAAVSAYAKSGADHPTLPEMWKATTIEPTVGKGTEAYNFVAVPTADNPSAMWSIYPGCQRLIYVPGYSGKRYLLGCDAVDCCC